MVGHIGSGQSQVRSQQAGIANSIQQRDKNSAPRRIGQRPAQSRQRRFPHLTRQHGRNCTVVADITATAELWFRIAVHL
ncbi:hypothetical protein L840_4326 [Mycobacterium sp. MAC_011194_8550]|nr:hypothetical protein L840_4326 [Mycobacterium sp. MAC_011194_8550]